VFQFHVGFAFINFSSFKSDTDLTIAAKCHQNRSL